MLCVFYMQEHSIWITVFYTPWRLSGKESACNAGDPGLVLGPRRSLWRRAWKSSPVFLPGKFHGQRRLEGYSPCGRLRVRHDSVTI